ncbi:hypothetical protein EQG68_14445 [Flavobacterium piscinae]|uniref:Uncharacterized protein n=2 Tax=Flavobacterium piscinae TaxID=2506424 RepID=A0A4Q1KGV3_9FLAO|nr:hypothetical protein [Flavobacterium piscinae]RXR28319.1 hypothetical protein EQG68_14445 [Flavobacterium piscinae]
MNNNLFFCLVLLSFNYNCAEVNSQDIAQNSKVADSVYIGPTHFSDDLVREDSLYTAIIRIDKQSEKEHVLSIQMNLKKNSYFVSATEHDSFKGKFKIVLTEPQHLQTNGSIIETPLSKVDENHGFVKLVRQNTHYKQSLKVLSNENFEVYGYLQFTIEPRCTLEKIPFILSYVDGKLSVKMDGC